METLLNSIWLAVALAAIATWRYRWFRGLGGKRSNALPEFVALVCALALLFPSVSLTDDLHPQIVAIDSASGKRIGFQLLTHASHGSHAAPRVEAHAATLPSRRAPLTSILTSRLVVYSENLHPATGRSVHHGRSPPASLL